jgi:hypothetical protein
MTRVAVLAVIVFASSASSARAQLAVVDPANLAQAVLIADRTLREYEILVAQYRTIARMAKGLDDMGGYRVPTIGTTSHDAARWQYGRPWLQGLNSGDPTGAAYLNTARQLVRPGTILEQLPPAARRAIEQAYATVEITDSAAQLGGHQVALVRGYGRELQHAVNALEGDVLNPLPRFHEITAILDKVAAGSLIGRRQDMAANQLLSHTLEQLLVRAKRARDTEATAMNMRIGQLRDGRAAGASMVRGAANDLRTWRQP